VIACLMSGAGHSLLHPRLFGWQAGRWV
jgi:hypothetical protein